MFICAFKRLGTCVWHSGSHDKVALVSVCAHCDSNPRFEQRVDWSQLDENESDFADIKKGPLLTRRVSTRFCCCCFRGGSSG